MKIIELGYCNTIRNDKSTVVVAVSVNFNAISLCNKRQIISTVVVVPEAHAMSFLPLTRTMILGLV